MIGLKIESLQKGLTWLHDHAKITFPPIPDDTFSLGALNSLDDSGTGKDSFLADPESTSSDMITATLIRLADKWKDSITTEALISGCVVLVWVFVVLIALARTASLWWKADNVRGDGGGRGTNFSNPMAMASTHPTVGHSNSAPSVPMDKDSSRGFSHLQQEHEDSSLRNNGVSCLQHNDNPVSPQKRGPSYPLKAFSKFGSSPFGVIGSRPKKPEPVHEEAGWIDEKRRGSVFDFDDSAPEPRSYSPLS